MRRLLITLIALILAVTPVYAAEEPDMEPEQVYTWVREGDAVFCYINNGGWSEQDMLVGFHTIDGEVYYFAEYEMDNFQYGQMVTGEFWYRDFTFRFDSEGHMIECYQGPEQ